MFSATIHSLAVVLKTEEERREETATNGGRDWAGYGAGEVLMMKTEEEKGRRGACITTGRRRTVGLVK